MNGINGYSRKRQRVSSHQRRRPRQRSTHKRSRHGRNIAAVRAFTAARLFRTKAIDCESLNDAAESCGASFGYARAADIVLAARDPELVDRVLYGEIPMFQAAQLVAGKAKVLAALDAATDEDIVSVLKTYGPTEFWDRFLVHAIDGEVEDKDTTAAEGRYEGEDHLNGLDLGSESDVDFVELDATV